MNSRKPGREREEHFGWREYRVRRSCTEVELSVVGKRQAVQCG